MAETTTTVGDTEVVIRETEDGFEVEEANDGSGLHVRAVCPRENFGFEIPLEEADKFDIRYEADLDGGGNGDHLAAWDQAANVDDDLNQTGYSTARQEGFDGYAAVQDISIVER